MIIDLLIFILMFFSGSQPTFGAALNISTTATSTFPNGINLTTGCLTMQGGSCVGSSVTPAFTYSTTTAWTGTTTISLSSAFFAETWIGAQCYTDTGTLWVNFHDGSNRMNYLQASTTVGTNTFTANNTFTSGEKRYVDLGNPASNPTTLSCTINRTI